jgi:quercetin dioxygenase-like cupin family protein
MAMDRKAGMFTAGMAAALVTAALTGISAGQVNSHAVQPTLPPRLHVSMAEIPWMTTNRYPEWFRRTYRYKELVGWLSNWQDAGGAAWKGVPNAEVRMGVLHLDRGAIYPRHFHPAPELYYVVRGTAEWTVGAETFRATPGTAIHAPPNALHQMVNVGSGTLELLYFWWAPGGDSTILSVPSSMGPGWDSVNGQRKRRAPPLVDR